jgi:hypothetical protein
VHDKVKDQQICRHYAEPIPALLRLGPPQPSRNPPKQSMRDNDKILQPFRPLVEGCDHTAILPLLLWPLFSELLSNRRPTGNCKIPGRAEFWTRQQQRVWCSFSGGQARRKSPSCDPHYFSPAPQRHRISAKPRLYPSRTAQVARPLPDSPRERAGRVFIRAFSQHLPRQNWQWPRQGGTGERGLCLGRYC